MKKGYKRLLMLVGIEKDRHRYTKDIIFNILIFLLISFLIYYIFGMIIGFYKIDNYFNLYGIKTFILPLILFNINPLFRRLTSKLMVIKKGGNFLFPPKSLKPLMLLHQSPVRNRHTQGIRLSNAP